MTPFDLEASLSLSVLFSPTVIEDHDVPLATLQIQLVCNNDSVLSITYINLRQYTAWVECR